MMDHHRGTHGSTQLQHGPADLLVELKICLVHKVDGESAVDRVAEPAAGTGPLEPAPHLRQDAAACDELGREECQLAMTGTRLLDLAQDAVEVREVGPDAGRAEAEPGNMLLVHG